MMGLRDARFVLAFHPTTHGYAFVLFEAPDAPFDWAVREIRGRDKSRKTLEALRQLVERYHPDVVVTDQVSPKDSRRTSRMRRLHRRIEHLAATQGIELQRFTRRDIRAVFECSGAVTKHEIAEAIAAMIPAFAHRLPRKRKIWMSEDPRQGLFDAAALGLCHFSGLTPGTT